MARLNDPPLLITESVDALKRRFVRQNREIARSNSNQSIRIRTLEAENSRLLTENANLQERIIKLGNEREEGRLENWRKVETVKNGIACRLADISALLKDLCETNEISENQRPHDARSLAFNQDGSRLKAPRRIFRSFDQRSDSLNVALSPVAESYGIGELSRYVIHLEEKKDRRPLTAYLLARPPSPDSKTVGISMLSQQLDSPDPGPPPTSHLVDAGEVLDLQVLANDNSPCSVPQLDKRRKRRETCQYVDLGLPFPENMPEDTVKTHANHSFKDLETKSEPNRSWEGYESGERSSKIVETGDMNPPMNRQIQNANGGEDTSSYIGANGVPQTSSTPIETPIQFNSSSPIKGTKTKLRRPLAAKSVNIEPQSPAKIVRLPAKSRYREERSIGSENRNERENSSPVIPKQERSYKVQMAEGNITKHRGISKRALEQTTFKPSNREDRKTDTTTVTALPWPKHKHSPIDNPAEAEITIDDQKEAPSRTTRRQRSSIVYTEPSLRDKMRRPTKDLVDAVAAMNARGSSSVGIKAEPCDDKLSLHDIRPSGTMERKMEGSQDIEHEAHLSDGTRMKVFSESISKDIDEDRSKGSSLASRPRESQRPEPAAQHGLDQSIRLKINGRSERQPGPNQSQSALCEEGDADTNLKQDTIPLLEPSTLQDGLSIFDLSSSSPPSHDAASNGSRGDQDKVQSKKLTSSRASRRHSTLANSSEGEKPLRMLEDRTKLPMGPLQDLRAESCSSLPQGEAQPSLNSTSRRTGSRRRSMMV